MSNESTGSALGGLHLYPTGLSRTELELKGGKEFWNDANRIVDQSILGADVDGIMGGKAAPRVWAFVAESGQSGVAVAAALSCAAALAERGQSVILLDGDDHHPDLTRWAGRFELEGWIDLIRYGASLTTCSIPMELKGRKSLLVGVGSFCPTQVTEQEIDDLLGRLRRRADDILMIIPAGEQGQPWAARAQIRLLGWDQSSRSAKAAQEMIDWLDDRGIKLTGLVGFGHETDDAVATRLRPAASDVGAAPGGPAVAEMKVEPTASANATGGAELAQETAKTVAAVNDVASAAAAGETTETTETTETERTVAAGSAADAATNDGDEPSADFWSEPASYRSSGNNYWWLAALAGICVLAAGIYYVENLNPTPTPRRGDLVPESVVSAPASGEDELVTGEETATAAESTADAVTEGNELAADAQPTADAQPIAEAAPPVAAGGSRPYGVPVGQDGWTLHLYSFPNSDLAQAEVASLERRGYRAAIRAADIPDKGRWYRVYVGSFASRNEALAARPALLERVGTDWAMPFSF